MTQDIRVERCPSCGAPYNVTRLDTGATFSCRRCGADVRVAGEALPPPSPSRGALATAAVALGGALALRATPWPPAFDADWILLAATALAFLVLAIRPRPFGFVAAGGLLLLFLLRSEGPDSSLVGGAPEIGAALARIALGAGALALGSLRLRGRGAARILAAAGALGVLAAPATMAALASDGASELSARARSVLAWWNEIVWRGGTSALGSDPMAREIPWALTGAAAALALLAAALPERRTGPVVRLLARLSFVAILIAWLAGPASVAWAARDALLGPDGAASARRLAEELLLQAGFAAWLGGAVLVAHAAVARGAAPKGALARATTGGWHVAAALVAAFSLLLLENPTTGAVALRWPWDVASAAPWDRAVAFAALLGLAAAGGILLAAAPAARLAGSALLAGLAAMAVDTGVSLHGVPRGAWAVLPAIGGGVLWARRGTRWGPPGRWAAALAGGAILVLLLWPRTGTEIAVAHAIAPWDCALLRWIAAIPDGLRGGVLGQAFWEPAAVLVPVTALGALVALAAAATNPTRVHAILAAATALAAALYPPVHAFATAWPDASGAGAGEAAAWGAASHALLLAPAAGALAAFAASSDATGRLH